MASSTSDSILEQRVCDLLPAADRSPEEQARLAALVATLATLPPPPDMAELYAGYGPAHERLLRAVDGMDGEGLELAFVELYAVLHGYEVPLSEAERVRFRARQGYLNHVGGLSPILKAGPFIAPDTVSADFGAGNGLQGSFLQLLTPHARTVQIEISGRLVEAGRVLQHWLGIPATRVEWIHGDVAEVSPAGMDFVYLYRPVRPVGEGRAFYERFAELARGAARPRIIFSIADCLGDFLGSTFEVFYGDGHLTCFRRVR